MNRDLARNVTGLVLGVAVIVLGVYLAIRYGVLGGIDE